MSSIQVLTGVAVLILILVLVPGVSADYSFVKKLASHGNEFEEFASPVSVAIDPSGYVYVLEQEGGNRVQKFTSHGDYMREWGSSYHGGSDDGDFNNPSQIAVNSSGYVYVADTGNYRIQLFNSQGNFLRKWSSWGAGDHFTNPRGVATDAQGNVYVADGAVYGRIVKFGPGGDYIREWGPLGSGITQLAADEQGDVYVADAGANRIQKFDAEGNELIWGPVSFARFGPRGVAVDSLGNVYVSDTGSDRIQKFDAYGNYITEFGSSGPGEGQLEFPQGLAVNSGSIVYVADTSHGWVQVFSEGPITSGTISVTSTPPGALIFIDTADTGQITPASIPKAPGTYSVYVNLAGYEIPPAKSVLVEAGKVAVADFPLTAEPPTPTGTLHVTSTPEGAEIFINDVDTGKKTPADIDGAPGMYKVAVGSLAGYIQPAPQSAMIESGTITSIDFQFLRGGTVYVTSTDQSGNPHPGLISIDGHDTGKSTPAGLESIAAGHHWFGVRDIYCGSSICGGYFGSAEADITASAITNVNVPLVYYEPLMTAIAACPVDLSITDPKGHTVSGLKNEIPGAIYFEYGPGVDGRPDTMVMVPEGAETGEYLIAVMPKPGALPEDTFTLTVFKADGKIVLADNVPISGIPAEPYHVTIARTSAVPEYPGAVIPALLIVLMAVAVFAMKAGRD